MEKKYYPTVGLEIHAELKTQTKMFCACLNNPDEEKPNVNICPVCMAHPGTLPVPNKKAIENVIKVGLAINGDIADFTEFDRKNYFYPDIPKGYQISQFKYPIVSWGHLADFDVTRIHLEEDTANNKHRDEVIPEVRLRGDSPKSDFGLGYSLIDFNRAGVPLMELVTEPHSFESDEEAAKASSTFAKELQLILKYLGVSEANMEKGEMRVEANISISENPKVLELNKPRNEVNREEIMKLLGTKVEVKNLNSFKSVERAIKFEVDRMMELIESGKGSEIVQETRGWDESKMQTFSQRKKEGSADYRYFPDPDLPKMKLHSEFDLEKMKSELPELPAERRNKYKTVWKHFYELKEMNNFEDIEYDKKINFLIENTIVSNYLDSIIKNMNLNIINNDFVKNLINTIINDIYPIQQKYPEIIFPGKLTAEFVPIILSLRNDGMLTNIGYKEVIEVTYKTGVHPFEYAKEHNLLQENNEGVIKTIVEKIISENADIVAIYKSGKENVIMSLVGKVIKESKGSANPQLVIKMLKDLLK